MRASDAKRVRKYKRGVTRKDEGTDVDEKVLSLSVDYAMRQPRIAFYSPFCAAILNYIKSVTPRFSISEEVAKIVEVDLMRRYPIIGGRVKKMLEKRIGR